VVANNATLRIGARTAVGRYSILNGGCGIDVGEDCLLAAFVSIYSSNHKMAKNRLIREQGYIGAPVMIGDDVWIGGHVSINMGVKIGRGSVIGAGAVVTHSVAAYKVAVGVPAKVVRDRE